MRLTSLDVRYAYRLILRREPESQQTVSSQIAAHGTLESLRESLFGSEEFQAGALAGSHPAKTGSPLDPADLDEPKLVFVHIPKCAGTTLHEILTARYPRGRICPERFNDLGSYPAAELARYRLFSGHFGFTQAQLIPGAKRLFTILRDPMQRLRSLYYFQRAHGPTVIARDSLRLAELANRYEPAEFFSLPEIRRHPAINNTAVRMIAGTWVMNRWEAVAPAGATESAFELQRMFEQAIKNLSAFTALGITERFDESLTWLFRELGQEVPISYASKMVLKTITRQDPLLKVVTPAPLSDALKESLAPLVHYDQLLYAEVNSRLTRAIGAMSTRPSGRTMLDQPASRVAC